jgi:hypothetical protein
MSSGSGALPPGNLFASTLRQPDNGTNLNGTKVSTPFRRTGRCGERRCKSDQHRQEPRWDAPAHWADYGTIRPRRRILLTSNVV